MQAMKDTQGARAWSTLEGQEGTLRPRTRTCSSRAGSGRTPISMSHETHTRQSAATHLERA
eukprot:m.275599 g.275599  ORF g.275599 m.275599 type:complete len:61 (+) comp51719_c0_seq1:193-375(+)